MKASGTGGRLRVAWLGPSAQQVMALSADTCLGHFDVTARLGEGGLCQVWQAIDTQLGRQVALTVSPEGFTWLYPSFPTNELR